MYILNMGGEKKLAPFVTYPTIHGCIIKIVKFGRKTELSSNGRPFRSEMRGGGGEREEA